MKPLRWILVTAVATFAAQALPSYAQTVDLPYKPAVGSRWIVTTVVKDTASRDGKAQTTTIQGKNTVQIVSKSETGFQITSTSTEQSFDGNPQMKVMMEPFIKATQGLAVTFETDDAGIPTKVVNLDKLKEVLIPALDGLVKAMPPSTPDVAQAMQGMQAQYASATAEEAVQLFLGESVQFAMVQGLRLTVGEELAYDDELTNPLVGSGTMPAKGFVKLASVDDRAGFAVIEWRQTIAPEDVTRFALETVTRLLPNQAQTDPQFQQALKSIQFDYSDKATYGIALADGTTRSMLRTTTITAPGMENVKTTTVSVEPMK
jgi:hypothetical protein